MTISNSAPPDVLIWAFAGGLVSVLSRIPARGVFTQRWLTDAIARLMVRTLVGIAASTILPVIGLGVMDIHAIQSLPRWALAFAVASSGFMFGRRWTS
ncbi:hypothetical protein [Paraburkholderia sp. RL17-337-BIB-A]|uniref:hypothetical protein n=1 Tax=Paraburkholderia sp. RL17-337-BIB-A TaxID=3031636 RepID=UPI0038BB754D